MNLKNDMNSKNLYLDEINNTNETNELNDINETESEESLFTKSINYFV